MSKLQTATYIQRLPLNAAIFPGIGKICALVELGDMSVESANVPLEQVSGEIRGYFRHEVRCKLCGQRFAIWIDTSDGSGGLCLLE